MTNPHQNPLREAPAVYRQGFHDSARFAILFRIFEALLLAPLAAMVAKGLMGRAVIDSTELVSVALSPRGFVAGFLTLAILITIRLVEHAGLSAITGGVLRGHRVTSPAALRIVLRFLPRLLGVACLAQFAGLLLVAPLLAALGYYASQLLSRHDINFYLAEWPSEFKTAIAVILAVAVPTVAALVWLSVRWQLVVQAVLFEDRDVLDGIRSSARLVRRGWWRSAGALVAIGVLLVVLGMIASLVDRLCGWGAALLVGEGLASQLTVFAGLLVVHTVLTGIVSLPGPCVAATVLTMLYRDLRLASDSEWAGALTSTASSADAAAQSPSRRSQLLLTAVPIGMLAVEIVIAVLALRELYQDRPIVVTAHRGGTVRSIENTLDAIREAIDDRAQFAEIDVQNSRDGVLVVTHDSDLSRLAGVASKIWDLTWDEIAAIPLRVPTAAEIPESRVPTFDEVLDLSRDRIRLNIELKYYGDHQPRLAERVIEAVRARGMTDRVIIQSLHYAGLEEVRRLAPEIPIGYLFSVNAREPKRLDVDFLSVQIGRVDAAFVRAAHRRKQEVHVWTVDKPGDMARMIDLGVDNLITNRPREALALIDEQANLAPPEQALRRLRAWLRE